VAGYDGGLLALALDLGTRLLPAFATPTGIPYGSVNLRRGVLPNESAVSSTAGGGTLSLEFSVLSRLTGDPRFEAAAKKSVRALWSRRSRLGLVGAHIDVRSGTWTHRDAGVGTSIDSFYEYLLKAWLLLGDAESRHMFWQAHSAVERHCSRAPWYVEVNMDSGALVWPLFNSLQAFWPGLQALAGRLVEASSTHTAFLSVWRRLGFTPEGYNLAAQQIQPGQASYPLRPELAESTYYLHRATGDPAYLTAGRDMVLSLRRARARCGYARVADVATGELSDHMESFFLAETVKYLFLLFDAGATWEGELPAMGGSFVDARPGGYVFSTEGHMLPVFTEHWGPAPAAPRNDSAVAPPQRSQTREAQLLAALAALRGEAAPAPAASGGECQPQPAPAEASPDEADLGIQLAVARPPEVIAVANGDSIQIAALLGTCAIPREEARSSPADEPSRNLSSVVRHSLAAHGAASPAVRALAAEVAAAQQGIVAAQLLALAHAQGLPTRSMQLRVVDDGGGVQRVVLFVEGAAPLQGLAAGVREDGLISPALPGFGGKSEPVEEEDDYLDQE